MTTGDSSHGPSSPWTIHRQQWLVAKAKGKTNRCRFQKRRFHQKTFPLNKIVWINGRTAPEQLKKKHLSPSRLPLSARDMLSSCPLVVCLPPAKTKRKNPLLTEFAA